MARLPRLTLPGYAHHVIQRGNNRQPIFVDDEDFAMLYALWVEHAPQWQVAVHAFVLMGNHFHLLVTPSSDTGLPQMMQAVGRRYVQYYNRRHARSGTLWEGRYRSTVLQADRYVLPCMVYMDLNPVRAGLVSRPGDYHWSSHAHWMGVRNDRLLTAPAQFWNLGNTPFAREAAYADLVHADVGSQIQAALTASTLSGWALGDSGFIEQLQKQTDRRVVQGQAGRPRLKNMDEKCP